MKPDHFATWDRLCLWGSWLRRYRAGEIKRRRRKRDKEG